MDKFLHSLNSETFRLATIGPAGAKGCLGALETPLVLHGFQPSVHRPRCTHSQAQGQTGTVECRTVEDEKRKKRKKV